MKNIYLVGFMGTGKTVVGKILAEKLGKTFIEMDEEIERREHRSISDIFAYDGEAHFRVLERSLLGQLSSKQDLVISCGGGLMCCPENVELLKKTGTVVALESSPQKIYERTRTYTHRPLLQVENPLQEITDLLQKRKPYYNQAHYTITSEQQTPQQVAETIMDRLHLNQNG